MRLSKMIYRIKSSSAADDIIKLYDAQEAASHVRRVYAFVGAADYAGIHAAFCCLAWPEQPAWRALLVQRFRPAHVGLLAAAASK